MSRALMAGLALVMLLAVGGFAYAVVYAATAPSGTCAPTERP